MTEQPGSSSKAKSEKPKQLPALRDDERIDGKLCLVTGASNGLGKAVATQLAERGGHVIMACRSGIPEAGEDVKQASGSDRVEMLEVDLASIQSVLRFCDELRDRGVSLDIVVLNAGLVPRNAYKTPEGFEVMFAVHFLANRLLLKRWVEDGVVKPNQSGDDPPRIIFVGSDTHQTAAPIDFERFGKFVDYGLLTGMRQYGSTKLHLSTLARELSRRLNPGDEIAVAVNALCPGPIDSNISHESPYLVKLLLAPIMRFFFNSPEVAAESVLYLACAREMGKRTAVYVRLMHETSFAPLALDVENGSLLWEKSEALLAPYLKP